jgi:hypothetical protein
MGHHYHNTGQLRGHEFVQRTLLDKLNSPEMAQLGVSWPVLVRPERDETVEFLQHRPVTQTGSAEPGVHAGPGGPHPAATENPEDKIVLSQTNFRVQFVWKPTGPGAAPPAGAGPAGPLTVNPGLPVVNPAPPAVKPGPPAVKPGPPPPAVKSKS